MRGHNLRAYFVAVLLALTGLASAILKPSPTASALVAPDLDGMLPETFGVWRRIAMSDVVLPQESKLGPGEAVAYRAYVDDIGRVVTLVAAYGPPLGESVRLHRPETCYVAQGFSIRSRGKSAFNAGARDVPIVNLDAENAVRREAVSYWLREGDAFTTNAGDAGFSRLRVVISGPIGGALVRVSTINADAPQFDIHREFLTDFAASLAPEAKRVLLGEVEAG
jgi:EpsI family protein